MIKENFDNNGHDYVDLGLPSKTLWATCNVGASKPSDSGLYFQWGDTQGYIADQIGEGKEFNWKNYKLNPSGDGKAFTKYATNGSTLELEDDAAHVNMGGDWHMPTPEQIQELVDNTIKEWTTFYDVNGILFTSNKDTSKFIFIPAAGCAYDGSVGYVGDEAVVWSSLLNTDNVIFGQGLFFNSFNAGLYYYHRCYGFSVRGVIDKNHDNFKEKKSNMNENLNLVEILKDAPKGTKLWSPVCGDCELDNINRNASYYPIECMSKNLAGYPESVVFTANGKSPYYFANGECVLFPSKDNKDWSTFKVSKKHKVFRTYQKVLVRELVGKFGEKAVWMADEYSHYDEDLELHYTTKDYGFDDDEIMPYEGNEDKVGTIAK